MAQVLRLKKFPLFIQKEIDQRLIESGFGDYELLAEELTRRGYRTSKSSLHRYGMQMKKHIENARNRERAIEAGITHEAAQDTGTGRTTVIVMDKHNGRARIIETDVAMHEVIAEIKRMAKT